jgi:hypothetical protein
MFLVVAIGPEEQSTAAKLAQMSQAAAISRFTELTVARPREVKMDVEIRSARTLILTRRGGKFGKSHRHGGPRFHRPRR